MIMFCLSNILPVSSVGSCGVGCVIHPIHIVMVEHDFLSACSTIPLDAFYNEVVLQLGSCIATRVVCTGHAFVNCAESDSAIFTCGLWCGYIIHQSVVCATCQCYDCSCHKYINLSHTVYFCYLLVNFSILTPLPAPPRGRAFNTRGVNFQFSIFN